MDNKQTEKTPKVPAKAFMTVGPTLHYSHRNVQRCWLLAVAAFGLSCFFWTKLQTGSLWAFDFQSLTSFESWRLSRSIFSGVSIFEYPWQILVLGLLMGILGVVPVLISQLLSFAYSIPFILGVFFLADLPGLAISLLISCIASACRPLRFRSRFIAIGLCMAPQLFYWGCFGGAVGVEPIKWGFSFAPWVCAWIVGLTIAALVLGIGHFTRYRPGLVWMFALVVFFIAVGLFEIKIGFDELDYQLYVARNNPENLREFHDHSITEALNKTITNPSARVRKYLESSFYPKEPIPLRAKLKEKIQSQLSYDRWPSWFTVPPELKYQAQKQRLFELYALFINRRPGSRRMPIALYYKALLSEYSPDIGFLEQKEMLHFYSDYPHERSQEIWYWLYTEFGKSPESLEARWRIAKHLASQGRLKQADQLLADAQTMLAERLKSLEERQPQNDTLFSLFQPPSDSAMTASDLAELQRRLNHLRNLLSPQNLTEDKESGNRLAKFIMLNPNSLRYADEIDRLGQQMDDNDPLRDNVLLAKTILIADELLRAESLGRLHSQFRKTDGGMEALYELGLLKNSLWLQQDRSNPQQKKKYLAETRAILTSFIGLYPDSFCAEQAKKILSTLPIAE